MSRTARRHAPAIVFSFLFAATLAGNWSGLQKFADRAVQDAVIMCVRGYCGNGEHADAFRELVERRLPPGESLYYCSSSWTGRLEPAERETHLALSWARSPDPVRFGPSEMAGDALAIVTSRFRKVDFPGYWLAGENDQAVLWRRGDPVRATQVGSQISRPKPWREKVSIIVLCALIASFVSLVLPRWQKYRLLEAGDLSGGTSVITVLCAIAFLALATTLALTHTFMAPAGLGVNGGKAKLFYLSDGFPVDFFTNPAFSSYQPAYPPGMALLTLFAYWVAGGCGEWLTQVVTVFVTALTLWLTAGRGEGSRGAVLWIMATFMGEQTLQIATLYYAETFVALLSLLGWARLREDVLGWMLLGVAGVFKTEGFVLTFAVWVAFGIHAISTSRDSASGVVRPTFLTWVKCLSVASFLPLSWHLACRMAGAGFYDYAPLWAPDFARLGVAASYLLRTAFLEPWRYGFAYPVAVLAVVAMIVWKSGKNSRALFAPLPVAALTALICLAAFACVYSFSQAPNLQWHLWSSAARLLWAPSLFVLTECVAISSGRMKGQALI